MRMRGHAQGVHGGTSGALGCIGVHVKFFFFFFIGVSNGEGWAIAKLEGGMGGGVMSMLSSVLYTSFMLCHAAGREKRGKSKPGQAGCAAAGVFAVSAV